MKTMIVVFLSLISMSMSFAQEDCDSLAKLEERIERMRLTCSPTPVKCTAGYSRGLTPEEAVKGCVDSKWGSRNMCITYVTCENAKIVKCNVSSHYGLTPAEAVDACVTAEFGNRNTCINYLKCENKTFTKCKAGNSLGLTMEEAVSACVESEWGSRESCINYAKCTYN